MKRGLMGLEVAVTVAVAGCLLVGMANGQQQQEQQQQVDYDYNYNYLDDMPAGDTSGRSKSEFLALKHESKILGHSSNPVCGFPMMEQVRRC